MFGSRAEWARANAPRRSLAWHRLLWIAVALAALAVGSLPASAHYYGISNPWATTTLCYKLRPDIAQDPNWPGWIRQAIANWNKVSNKTGWKFEECKDDQKADFEFSFLPNEAKPPGGITASATEPTLRLIKIVKNIDGFSTNNQLVQGGIGGWDTKDGPNGQKTLDPVLTMMHELTHVMLLDHVGGCSTVDLEEPVCPGDHATRTVSNSDINEIRFGHNLTPIETVKPPPLPSCFATAEDKRKFLQDLKDKIDALEADIKKLSAEIAALGPAPQGNEALTAWAAKKTPLEFQSALDNVNLQILQLHYSEAEAVGLCGHSMRTVTGGGTQVAMNTLELGIEVGGGSTTNGFEDYNFNGGGIIGGVSGQYNVPIGAGIYGGVGVSVLGSGMSGTTSDPITANIRVLVPVDALAGVTFASNGFQPPISIYGFGGVAIGWVNINAPPFSTTQSMTGWSVGIGADMQISRMWSLGLKYRHFDLGTSNFAVFPGGTSLVTERGDMVTGTLSYRFPISR